MRARGLLALAVFALSATAPVPAAAPRGTLPEDLLRLKFISGAHISHDGKRVAFVVQTLDARENEYRSDIWLVDAVPGRRGPRALTQGGSDEDPEWSPDDRTLAFTRGKEGKQIYRIALDGGEAVQLTHAEHGAAAPVWSHDGTRIAFGETSVDAQAPTALDEKAAGFKLSEKQKKSDIRRIDRLDFELNGPGYTYNKHPHFYVMRADGTRATRVTPLSAYDDTAVAWSADDRMLAFNSLRGFDPYRFRMDVYVVPVGGGPLRRVPTGYAVNLTPMWLHHRNALVSLAGRYPDPAEHTGIALSDLSSGAIRTVLQTNRYLIGDAMLSDTKETGAGCGPIVAPDDRWALFDASVPGATTLMRFDLASGAARTLVARGDEISECSADKALDRIAFVASDATHPAEVWVADVATGAQRRLTGLNDGYLHAVALSKPQRWHVRDDAGFSVDAWFVPALGVRGRAPTLL
ncbi:MAG: PD40 domain-containing protein, partial [Candidatus Eremiobacteraeota bacterium]|nr:PD40 domain-containing protein [Candidatus Eremiobacteraeota bacterium]